MDQNVSSSSTIAEMITAASVAPRQAVSRKAASIRAGAGAFLGLAWGAALRAWMVLLAVGFGEQPHFTWKGTFGGILLPAALVGAILGLADAAAGPADRKRWRWAILSPVLLVVGPAIASDNFLSILLTTGMGGGAIGVALIGLLGGYAFSGFGAAWTRWVAGVLALLFTLAAGVGIVFVDRSKLAAPTAERAFSGLLFVLLMGVLIAGISAPFWRRSKQPVGSGLSGL